MTFFMGNFVNIKLPNAKLIKLCLRLLVLTAVIALIVGVVKSYRTIKILELVGEQSLEYCLEHHKQDMEDHPPLHDDSVNATSPRSVIVWSRWRMGSSFVAELLSSTLLRTFYSCESLHPYNRGILWNYDDRTHNAMQYLQDLLKCKIKKHRREVEYFSKHPLVMRNPVLQDICYSGCCHHPEMVQWACKSSDIIVSKLVKLRLVYARELLEKPSLNTTIVFLTRDPRAVMQSRTELGWCNMDDCSSPRRTCELLRDDLQHTRFMAQKYPENFIFLRYEDLSQRPESVMLGLWKKLKLPLDEELLATLEHHISSTDFFYNQFSTRRQTKQHLDEWRSQISWEYVKQIQKDCGDVLQLLGLRLLRSEVELRDLTFSVVESKEQVRDSLLSSPDKSITTTSGSPTTTAPITGAGP